MKQKIEINEKDLIREWKHNRKEDIALYFFNKYKDVVLSIVYKKINNKFSSIPLEKGDFFFVVWKSVLKTLKNYKLTKNGSFKNLLMNNAYNNCVKEALKFIRNGHIILNTSYSYDKILDGNKTFNLGKNGQVNINNDYNTIRNNFINNVIEFNKEFEPKFLKRVVYLKSLGYSLNDISKKINRPLKEIKAAVDFMVYIARKLYD